MLVLLVASAFLEKRLRRLIEQKRRFIIFFQIGKLQVIFQKLPELEDVVFDFVNGFYNMSFKF